MEDWFWACGNDGPAGDAFVIANGKDELWARVRNEISRKEDCAWNAVHRGSDKPKLEHILNMLLTVVYPYQVNHNKWMFEAAQMPVFARFLRDKRDCDLCNYVSNPMRLGHAVAPEPYSNENMRRLGRIVNDTLNLDDEGWFTLTGVDDGESKVHVVRAKQRYRHEIEEAIGNAKDTGGREIVNAANGEEIYAYPIPGSRIAWGVNDATGWNILRGIRRPDGGDEAEG